LEKKKGHFLFEKTCSLLFNGGKMLKRLDGIQTTFNFKKIRNKNSLEERKKNIGEGFHPSVICLWGILR